MTSQVVEDATTIGYIVMASSIVIVGLGMFVGWIR